MDENKEAAGSAVAHKNTKLVPFFHYKRLGRELAMQFLYQCDIAGMENTAESIETFWSQAEHSGEFPYGRIFRKARTYAEKIIAGVFEHEADFDQLIKENSDKWDITRMAVVDLNIIRVAMMEMFYMPEIPILVSINEAIEIAKDYSTSKSCIFINGLLNAIKVKVPEGSKLPPAKQPVRKDEEK